ncbi:hypothetical protein A8990_10485 [Paenibacillus taihuensis]|uniref:Uncharacterized protein n=1 Tax=Paenibacillus taihuensis TaxID=1156355 RepID=A0A3D9SCF5_9BACL|nr:hypothetical protein A8990_10485 [Paenibacillus taihuensis]
MNSCFNLITSRIFLILSVYVFGSIHVIFYEIIHQPLEFPGFCAFLVLLYQKLGYLLDYFFYGKPQSVCLCNNKFFHGYC